jgi:ABC-type glycerol-3-phosphate transport system substrate-binding protein
MSDEKRLSRRNFLRLSGGVTAAVLLAACAPKATPAPEMEDEPEPEMEDEPEPEMEDEPEPEVEEEVEEAPEPREEAVIEWWGFGVGFPADEWPHGKWEGERAEEYTAMDNGVTVEFQALGWDMLNKWSTAVAAGTPPELVLRASHGRIKGALDVGLALEFDLEEDLRNDLPEGFEDAIKFYGKNYVVPFYNMAQGALLNMDLVEEAGAEDLVPGINGNSEEWRMEDWLELMKALTFERDDGSQTYGYVIPSTASNPYVLWPIWLHMWNWGANTLKLEGDAWVCAMADDIGIQWLEYMYDLYDVHGITPNPSGLDTTVCGDYWDQNQNGWIVGPSIGRARQAGTTIDPETLTVAPPDDIRFRFVQQPTSDGSTSQQWGGPTLDVNQLPYNTEKGIAAETIRFAHWIANRDHQAWLAQYQIPVRVSALETVADDPIIQWIATNWLPEARLRNFSGCSREEAEQWMVMWQKLYLPSDATEVANWFCDEVSRFGECWYEL